MTPDDLIELEAIRRLKHRYVRCLDEKRWAELEEVFTEDAVASYGDGEFHYEGRDAILGFLTKALGDHGMITSHRVGQEEIDLTGPGAATGTWGLSDVVIIPAANMTIRGAAFYHDEYVKHDGEWRIRRTGYERLYEEREPRDTTGVQLSANRWGA